MKYLITGGCGFLGSNIAARLVSEGSSIVVFDNLSRMGANANLDWLHEKGVFAFVHGDVRNAWDIGRAVIQHKPDIIFHLAGQVAMTTSIDNPRMDFEINAAGSFNVLEAVRNFQPDCGIIYSSTNKVYGDLEWVNYVEGEKRYEMADFPNGLPETIPLDFHSPYGTSKGSADQYMADYARIYGLKTAVFRHSSMYGGRQFATADQGWIGWFCQKALEQKNTRDKTHFTISGNGKQVRDLLYADDMVSLYIGAAEKIDAVSGMVFNIGGGVENSVSLLELFDFLENELSVNLVYEKLPPRISDQKVFIADISKIKKQIDWAPRIDKSTGIRKMLQWVSDTMAG